MNPINPYLPFRANLKAGIKADSSLVAYTDTFDIKKDFQLFMDNVLSIEMVGLSPIEGMLLAETKQCFQDRRILKWIYHCYPNVFNKAISRIEFVTKYKKNGCRIVQNLGNGPVEHSIIDEYPTVFIALDTYRKFPVHLLGILKGAGSLCIPGLDSNPVSIYHKCSNTSCWNYCHLYYGRHDHDYAE